VAVYISGIDNAGKKFGLYLHCDGEHAPFRMNTLHDLLTGVDLEESMRRQARWVVVPCPGKSLRELEFSQYHTSRE
jgi:hypothetical protein